MNDVTAPTNTACPALTCPPVGQRSKEQVAAINAFHTAAKSTPAIYVTWELIGYGKDEDGNPELEMRNCACGSTVSRFCGATEANIIK